MNTDLNKSCTHELSRCAEQGARIDSENPSTAFFILAPESQTIANN